MPSDASLPGYASYSFWLETTGDDLTPRPALDGSIDVDVAILGAGYSGLWTAYYLLKRVPSVKVAIVEKEIAGFGASGRNGGWCSARLNVGLNLLASRHGAEAARALIDHLREAVDEIGRFCAAERIDAGFTKTGALFEVFKRRKFYHSSGQRSGAHGFAGSPVAARRDSGLLATPPIRQHALPCRPRVTAARVPAARVFPLRTPPCRRGRPRTRQGPALGADDSDLSQPGGGAWARASVRGRCCRILRITAGSRMNSMTRIVPPQAQRSGSTSNTLMISLAHCRRRSRCVGAGESDSLRGEAGSLPAPALRHARAPRVQLA